jgi:hypothetical protein
MDRRFSLPVSTFMSTRSDLLNHPPFPPMQWSKWGCWEGEMELPTHDEVGLTVTPCAPDISRAPSPEQGAAYTFILENCPHVLDSILTALLPYYQEMRPRYRGFLGSEYERLMPAVQSCSDLLPLVDLRHVYVDSGVKNGCAYVGWSFGCTWDAEHALGAMMHRDRVVEIGGADVSFAWTPEEA